MIIFHKYLILLDIHKICILCIVYLLKLLFSIKVEVCMCLYFLLSTYKYMYIDTYISLALGVKYMHIIYKNS